MSQRIVLEILLILVLVLANGVLAMSEIALVSARKPRLHHLAQRGSRRAAKALRLADNPDRFLSTVQVGITLIGIFTGVFGGATIAGEIDDRLEGIPALQPWSEVIGFAIVVLSVGYLSLVLGELVPKRLALNDPERAAMLVAPAMGWLSRAAAPAVALLAGSTRLVLRLLRVRESNAPPAVTEQELKAMARAGIHAGTIEREESEIVERVFRLTDRPVTALMTPRVDLEWLNTVNPLESLRQQVAGSVHAWFPIADGTIDAVTAVARGRDLWAPGVNGAGDLMRVSREPIFVPQTTTAAVLLRRFRESGVHVAVVIDEVGGVMGLVTTTDLLEALVGELPQVGDPDGQMIVRLDEGAWSVDAGTDVDEVKLVLGVDYLAGQKETYQTIAGYVVDHLGRTPPVGASFAVDGLRFEVLDADGRRIDRIRVERKSPADPAAPEVP